MRGRVWEYEKNRGVKLTVSWNGSYRLIKCSSDKKAMQTLLVQPEYTEFDTCELHEWKYVHFPFLK
jgi:hypothetical protein